MPTPGHTGRTWSVPYYVRGLALGIPIYLAAIHLWTWVLYVPDSLGKGGLDFRQSYSAAYMLRTGHGSELYDYDAQKRFQDQLVSIQPIPLLFVEPAYEALLFEPFSLFSFRAGYFLFVAVNVALLCGCFVLLAPWLMNLRIVYWWLPGVMLVGFLPVAVALIQGQDSILLTAALVGAFVLLSKGREFLAGLVLGLAIFKFQIVLPIVFLFLIWQHWKFLCGCATSGILGLGMGAWATGWPTAKFYVFLVLSLAGLRPSMSKFDSYPVLWTWMACIHGTVFTLFNSRASHRVLILVSISLSAIVLIWTAWRGSRIPDRSTKLLLAIVCSTLVGHHVNTCDDSVWLLPVFVMLSASLPWEQFGRSRARIAALVSALMFVVPVGISWFPSHFSLTVVVVLAFLAVIGYLRPGQDFRSGPVLVG